MERRVIGLSEALWLVYSGFAIGISVGIIAVHLFTDVEFSGGVAWAIVLPLLAVQYIWRKLLPEYESA